MLKVLQLIAVQGATGPQGSDQPTKQGAQGITGASKTSSQGNKGVQLGQATQGATGPQGSDQPTKQGAQGITQVHRVIEVYNLVRQHKVQLVLKVITNLQSKVLKVLLVQA